MNPVDKWKPKKHKRLTKAVIKRLPKSDFNSSSVAVKQLNRRKLLTCEATSSHASWTSLDGSRRSSACLFERARVQIFMAGIVLPRLQRLNIDWLLVTIADTRWRVEPYEASRTSFHAPRRKVRAGLEKLRRNGNQVVYVAAYELSGDRCLTKPYSFEPHVHLLLGGTTKQDVLDAFKVRLPRAAKGRNKPLRVEYINASELGKVLGYVTKMRAQDRVEFCRSDGRKSRISNDMRGTSATQWIRCMASMPITELVQFGGFDETLASRFTHLEMASIIGELK